MILYRENPKVFTKKKLSELSPKKKKKTSEQRKDSVKISGNKINIKKFAIFNG